MKKLLGFLAVSLILCVSNTYAMPMPAVNDTVTLSWGTFPSGTGGGEFLINGDNYEYTSFCLEIDEYISLNTNYKIGGVDDFATHNTKGYDYVSDATKWLMNQYINFSSDLFAIDYFSKYSYSKSFARDVQNAIWFLEGEIYTGNGITDWLLNAAEGGFTKDAYTAGYLPNVKVLNLETLVDGNVIQVQSQLIAAPVPEPATMLLLGTGLIGLAGVSRKKFKK